MGCHQGEKMKASIDIGSNTVLLLVGQVEKGNVSVVKEKQRAPRLGKGVDEKKNLDSNSMQRVLEVLKEYQAIIHNQYGKVEHIKVVATSAVRDANNRREFVDEVKKQTGLNVQILSGLEEAKLTYKGARSVLPNTDSASAVIDIGGGSTEIAWGKGDALRGYFSFDIGSVRFTERYLKSDPPTVKQITDCKDAVRITLQHHKLDISDDCRLIGVAGTVTSLALIVEGLQNYKASAINGEILTIDDISSSIKRFSKMTSAELLEHHPIILKGRADVFLAGLLILEGFMNYYHLAELTVSTGGIRHGAILNI